MSRTCDRIAHGARCSTSSCGLFSVLGSRMRLCTEHRREMEETYRGGVVLVSQFCEACRSEPCICALRSAHKES